ncbi:MAG TPA: hypothetical protein VI603_15750 [Saprospiraceae bacterium]|nr:hypothetical protein [Saprospiraceae bacterium]
MFQCAIEIESSFEPKQLQIYVISDPRCGYCDRALRQIGAWAVNDKRIDVIAMDVSEKAKKIRANEALKFYNEYSIRIIDASPCGMKYKKFIPKVYVFDRDSGDLLWKLRGWGKGDIDKLKSKLSK